MAAGRAIVSSDQGGMPELIRDNQNGILAKTEDPDSYISGLEKLIESRSLREQLGTAARQTIEKSFTDVHIASLSADFYREQLSQGR
jgi:glycosyltransferase involved in cell wall biosynthesis